MAQVPSHAAAPGQRLATRIVALSLALLLSVQLAGFWAIRSSIDANARARLGQELDIGQRIWQRLLEQKSQALADGAKVLAADYGFRSAVGSGDAATIGSALENHAARIGARLAAWVDTAGTVHAAALNDRAAAEALRPVAAETARQASGQRVAVVGGQAYQFVAVPMKAPVTIGWMVLGFALDASLLGDMRALSGLHVALRIPQAEGSSHVAASTLAPDAAAGLATATGPEVVLDGESMLLRRLALGDAPAAAQVLLLQSVDEALAPYRRLQWTLALITGIGVLVFGAGSVVTARRVTTPLSDLVGAAQRLGSGDYAQPLAHTTRRDEIGNLARAFDHMRVSIAGHEAEIRQLAYHDRLTGLPNRAFFREGLQARLADPRSGSLTLVKFGLDRFKHVNDVLGYRTGDEVLRAVAGRLGAQARHEGSDLAHLGGDKFGLLLPGGDAEHAQQVVQRLVALLEQPLVIAEQTVDVRAAFGIACWPQHAGDADTLLNRAEVAMYVAKRKASTFTVYDPAIDSASAQTLSLLSELRRALQQGELRLFLQPKLRLADGALVGAEALLRWQHPQRGLVPPLHFIPFAEQTGFVRQLTLWLFEDCARRWPALQRSGLQRLSLNLSTRDLMDAELPERLQRILQRHGVDPAGFCLEITESAIMDEPQRALAVLDTLAERGFKLSIDDFGTGYSSLAYLKRLPVHELKIDKSFVMGMAQDADDAKIVRSTIDLAHNLGLSVVAEGVESAAIGELLRDLQCDEAQGYHISRPMPADDLHAFAAAWRSGQDASDPVTAPPSEPVAATA